MLTSMNAGGAGGRDARAHLPDLTPDSAHRLATGGQDTRGHPTHDCLAGVQIHASSEPASGDPSEQGQPTTQGLENLPLGGQGSYPGCLGHQSHAGRGCPRFGAVPGVAPSRPRTPGGGHATTLQAGGPTETSAARSRSCQERNGRCATLESKPMLLTPPMSSEPLTRSLTCVRTPPLVTQQAVLL